ncbi:hypothetical protein [Niveibacterium sp. COAC-50]|uniref:hypothetical protein n=1 Tax=Niveibacterium sp. COAC-50 TaxID=2729384 RepID=UPI001553DAF0|nr:hypothetical protein [Niveibacterium sp. COAC-50]
MTIRRQNAVFGNDQVQQALAEDLSQKNASARTVPAVYRFDELQCLERWERAILVAEAKRYAMRQPKVLALWALLGAVAGYFASICLRERLLIPAVAAWVGAAALMAPVYFYRRSVMRAYIRQKVSTMQQRAD